MVSSGVYRRGCYYGVVRKSEHGKTTLVACLIEAPLGEKPFLNGSMRRTPIVYLTEQPRVSFRLALQRANLTSSSRLDLSILYFNKTIGVPWATVAANAADECRRLGAKLLVVTRLPSSLG
jgi:hypothetical protein